MKKYLFKVKTNILLDNQKKKNMKYLFRLKIVLLLLSFAVMRAQTDPDLELTEGSADITIKGPTDNVTFNFLRDANNPGTPSYNPAPNPLSVTFKISNNQHTYTHFNPSWPSTRSFDFGNLNGAPDYISQKLATGSSNFGYAANYSQLFTYAGYATPGTGIVAPRGSGAGSVLNQNYAVNTYITTNGLADAGIPSNSTVYMADFTVEFSRPVNNPVLHFVGLGAVLNSMNASAMYELNPTLSLPSSGVSLSKLSGSPNFNVSGLQVSNSDFPIQQLGQAAGSVLVTGKGIIKLVFKVYIKGDGNTSNGNDPSGWGLPPVTDTNGDQQMISVSVQESELQITKTIDKPNARVGENVVFTVTATNNGISNSPNTLVNDLLPSGYTFVSATPSLGTYNSTTGVWNIGLLGGSTNATLAITATVNTSASQSNYTNTATITGDNVDLDLTNNSATVTPNVIDAVNDSYTMPSSGGNVTGSVLDNDTYNTTAIPLSGTTITVVTPATGGGPVPTLNTSTGIVNVPAGTPPGTYTITYQICRASACDQAVITVNVTAGLDLNPDSGNTTVGTPIVVPNVVANDTYNGAPITIGAGAGQGTVTQSGTWPAGITLNPATGDVNVAGTVPAGTYPVVYQVCINGANPAQCATETVNITVTNTLSTTPDTGSGTTGTTFIAVPNVTSNDSVNGATPVIGSAAGQVTISEDGNWPPGFSLNPATGEVTVDGTVTPSTYTMYYQICVNGANPALCTTEVITITVNAPAACYNPVTNTGAGTDTKHGITLLKRAGADNGNWPMIRKSAHTVLESNTKGFVITRVADPAAVISNPVEGMMVYDTIAQCLKIFSDGDWNCFLTPACP